jgi:type IV pilus assembly protein PilF
VKTRTLLFLLPLVLAGCAGGPPAGQGAEAPVSQQTAVGDARQRAKSHAELGMRYLFDRQLNVALDEAKIAIQADSAYPLGYNLLGLVQMYLRDNRAAEDAFATALRLAPQDPEINNNYGWFLCQSGRERQSLAYFVTATKSQLYTSPTKPLTNAGICAVNGKDDKAAEDFFLRALRADPVNGDAQFLLAELYFRNGRHVEARARLAEIHRNVEPTAETAWLALRIERKLGDREAEAKFATVLRRQFAGSAEYQSLSQGKYE